MFDKLKGCWPSLNRNENIVAVKPLPYENITTRWPACKLLRNNDDNKEIRTFGGKNATVELRSSYKITNVLCLLWIRDAKAA